MDSKRVVNFQSLSKKVGKFDLKDKIFLIPQMNRIGGHLLAATFRGFGIRAEVMDTFQGLELGNEYTSGKECFPCQITMGDILHHMSKEKERLGENFHADDYVYFMPEAGGPCRFGMYNKYQRIVLDSIAGLDKLKIGSLSTGDGYSLDGIIEKERVSDLRKVSYVSVVAADILDRLLWRVRPYERESGMADAFIESAMRRMEQVFEKHGSGKDFKAILDHLDEIVSWGKDIIDPDVPPKPLIGIVGEIYLRTHVNANQDIIRVLERYGAEVVNASIAEWMNFTTYERLRDSKKELSLDLKQVRLENVFEDLKKMVRFGVDYAYQRLRQRQIFKRAKSRITSLAGDHSIGNLEKVLKNADIYSFDPGTEACLSISGIMEYVADGYNGVVNVYPFTCMPSTVTSAIVKPFLDKSRVPFLDTPYDASSQPGREAAVRTFMYQAQSHFNENGRKIFG